MATRRIGLITRRYRRGHRRGVADRRPCMGARRPEMNLHRQDVVLDLRIMVALRPRRPTVEAIILGDRPKDTMEMGPVVMMMRRRPTDRWAGVL
jgi:hypothetical protein